MELNYLRVFYEVAKVGRFTEAAKRLNISQSALSRSVALLEESEGVKLFERAKTGVTLTPTGIEVFRHCEQLFQTVNRISEVCRGIQEVCEGPLHFGTTDHVLNYILTQPLHAFRGDFPFVIPSIFIGSPDEVIDSLLNTENEFGLVFAKVNSPQIHYEALREDQMALVVEAGVWRENKGASYAATLNKVLEKVGYISSIGAHTQVRASRVLKELFGKTPRIGFETNSQEAQKRVCLSGGGIAYLSRFMVESEIKSGQLYEIEIEHPHAFKLWLATRKNKALSLPAKLFTDRLKTAIG